MARFKDKVLLLTGGASGIGRATAIACAKEGAKVVVGDINEEGALETVDIIKNNGGEAYFYKLNVANESEVKGMVDSAVKRYGRIDMAFNNAGIAGAWYDIQDYPTDTYDKVMAVNTRSVFLGMKYETKQMIKQGGKGYSIVNMSSLAGLGPFKRNTAYVASKHAVIGMTKGAAMEYATRGIRINAVCPSFIRTPIINTNNTPKAQAAFERRITELSPMKRIGEPEDVVKTVIFLLSDEASFTTGASLTVSGGLACM